MFKNLKISRKLILSFSVVMLILIVLGTRAFISLNSIKKKQIDIYQSYELAEKIMESKYMIRTDMHLLMEIIASPNENDLFASWTSHKDIESAYISELEDAIAIANKNDWGKENYELKHNVINQCEQLKKQYKHEIAPNYILIKEYYQEYLKFSDSSYSSTKKELLLKINDLDEKTDNIGYEGIRVFEKIEKNTQVIVLKSKEDSQKLMRKSQNEWIFLLIFSIVIIFVISTSISLTLSKSINKVVVAMKKISNKQIDFHIEEQRTDEIGELYNSINEINNNFRDIISNIDTTASAVLDASNQLNFASMEISERANEQASTTEEVASSMEQMLVTINSNTENAEITGISSTKSADGMKESNEVLLKTIKSVSEISEKITIITEIADKTDILSINAAIEAARVGDAGRGFAVVAQEIRKLADKTKIASDTIVNLSKEGRDISKIAGEKLLKTIPDIINSAKLVNNIVTASREQQNGVEAINNSILQLTEITNQNSASAEEMSASSEELSAQAKQLKSLISVFDLGKYQIDMTTKYQTKKPAYTSKKHDFNSNSNNDLKLDDMFEKY